MKDFFSVKIFSFVKPASENYFKAEVSAKTKNILNTLYDFANRDFVSGREYLISKLENSLFCCCFDEGFIIYSFFPRSSSGKLSMKGFFIPEEYMRTAWKLYLEDIIFLVSSGMCSNNIIDRDFDFVHKLAEDAVSKIDGSYLKEIKSYLGGMKRDAPYNFAMTRYPRQNLPVKFSEENTCSEVSEKEYEEGRLVIHAPALNDALKNISAVEGIMNDIYIRRNSKKNFIDCKKEELKEIGIKKADIREFVEGTESELENIQSEYVWYVYCNSEQNRFSCQLDPVTSNALENGCIDFSTLCIAVRRSVSRCTEEINSLKGNGTEEPKRNIFGFFKKK